MLAFVQRESRFFENRLGAIGDGDFRSRNEGVWRGRFGHGFLVTEALPFVTLTTRELAP